MTIKNKIKAKSAIRKIVGHIGFGEMIQAHRQSRELNQITMAEMIGISKQDLCNIEKGRKLVSVERAIFFAEALGMPKKTFAKYALQDQLYKAGISGEVVIKEVA